MLWIVRLCIFIVKSEYLRGELLYFTSDLARYSDVLSGYEPIMLIIGCADNWVEGNPLFVISLVWYSYKWSAVFSSELFVLVWVRITFV